ncbi:hemerythrin domain-containing protein [Arthrobacter silvisoli]|uniref:hemerythrin domain-containing protein n=1 Tax=Arthrobacter silvisoli TaxID=2291022 RepID=UPI000E211371|nr:hemerythrin domain-containing protein [Arthrobacter silvisoli]
MDKGKSKDSTSEAQALQAVERHHTEMLKQLTALVSVLMEAVEAVDAGAAESAHGALLAWCDGELIPHALAEEGPLYSGPHALPEGKLLVDGMLAEHKVIVDLVEELRISSGLSAVVAGAVIQRVFALHLEKENHLLMPFIAASPELSLAESVKGLHELVGGPAHQHEQSRDDGTRHH